MLKKTIRPPSRETLRVLLLFKQQVGPRQFWRPRLNCDGNYKQRGQGMEQW
jgi:hypothetical protein